ncbi:hypothetical protein NQ176_g6773 [Zarea fungicola]|uniref:Uncharacterized protein n=1 Tax=Zarea fungicola TaxID=93591 RepID=A0ACC1N2K5_9HYPO|nr:hypothetical protein NQ176_g6773 [Lecanicillium fungicola]
MRFTQTALSMALAATCVIASSDPTATKTEQVEIFVEEYADGEMVVDTSFVLPSGGNGTEHLEAREHHECWGNGLHTRQNQEAYEDDCEAIIRGLRNMRTQRNLTPLSSLTYRTGSGRCKVIVRNESRCHTTGFSDLVVANAAEDTLNHCSSLTQCSGWGYVFTVDRELIYIVEPFEYAPPTYSPRC